MATGNVVTGARARFSIKGVKVGYATGVSVREMIAYEPLKVMDSIHVQEHVPIDYEVSLSADLVRLVNRTIKTEGWFPEQGGSAEDHLTNILKTEDLTAMIEDTAGDGTVLMNIEGVRISERNMSIGPRGIVGTNVTMVAIKARDAHDMKGAS